MSPAITESASPCVGVCRIETASGFCRGCLRTLDEIAAWRDYSDAEKRTLLAKLGTRQCIAAEEG